MNTILIIIIEEVLKTEQDEMIKLISKLARENKILKKGIVIQNQRSQVIQTLFK